MKRIFVCSPFRGDTLRNIPFARAACRRIALAGDAPFAPHLLLPQFLFEASSPLDERGTLRVSNAGFGEARHGLAWRGEARGRMAITRARRTPGSRRFETSASPETATGRADERDLGIACGLAWLAVADEIHVFGNVITEGMAAEIAAAEQIGVLVRRSRP
jgi:hypothetical protein